MAVSESTTQQATPGKLKSRYLTVSTAAGSQGDRGVPHIRILGRWAEEAGFVIGSKVDVEVTHGRLVIELAPPETEGKDSAAPHSYIQDRMVMTFDPDAYNGVIGAQQGGDAS